MTYVVKYSQWGGPSVLRVEQENARAPGAGEVLIRQEAIGVNFVDTMFRDGTFKAGLPAVAGVEGAGTVETVDLPPATGSPISSHPAATPKSAL